jgi:archaellum component FlaC
MNDDIITRLRVSTVADTAESIYQTLTDAADEIERLREENATLKARVEEVARERDRWMSQTF